MPITPITPTGRLEIKYSIYTLTHSPSFFVDLVQDGGSGDYVCVRPSGLNPLTPLQVAQRIWDLMRELLADDVLAPTYEAFLRVENAYVPVSSGTLVGGGTSTSQPSFCSGLTVSFADVENYRGKTVVFENQYTTPAKLGVSVLGPLVDAWYQAHVDTYTEGGFADYIRTRNGLQPYRLISWTNTAWASIRSERGLR